MKILILSHQFYPDLGGIEINSEILSYSLSEMGHEIHLATWSQLDGPHVFPFKVIRNPSIITLLVEHSWADVILENNPCLRLSWPNFFFNKPSVVVLNTWVSRLNGKIGIQDKLKFFWLKRASRVIAVSEAIRETCYTNAVVIGNPYRAENFKIIKGANRSKDFVFLGRLVSDKGADFAIKALHQLIRETENLNPDAAYTLTIIGDGPELINLRQLAKELGVSAFIKFKGSLSGIELTNCLNEHKYLIVPSLWKEPFGNVALEGLACGCIPIVADGGGLPDAIGMAGLVFERGNLDSLVSSIKKLMGSANLQFRLKFNATTHLKSHQPDAVSKKYLEIIIDAYESESNNELQASF